MSPQSVVAWLKAFGIIVLGCMICGACAGLADILA